MTSSIPFQKTIFTSILGLFMAFSMGCSNQSQQEQDHSKDTAEKQSNLIDTLQKINNVNTNETKRGGKSQQGDSMKEKTIDIGYVNWTEGIAMTHLVESILEDKMGYTVNKRLGYVGEILDSLAWGTNDIFLDHWLAPDSSLGEMEDFVDAGINYKNARMGLVVPKYMDINSIEELKANKDALNGQIVGIDAGADVMDKTDKALKVYNLDYKLISSSGPAMISTLNNAIKNQKPIVITGWAPHWIFSKYELKFLNDPELVYGKTKNIHTLVRKGLEEDHPQVMQFLKNFRLNQDQLQNLIESFAEKEDWDKAAAKWIEDNEKLVNSWLPKKEG